jgi:hypothetical protein
MSTLNEESIVLKGLALVRTHGSYFVMPLKDAPAPMSLTAGSYVLHEPQIVPLSLLPGAVKAAMARVGSSADPAAASEAASVSTPPPPSVGLMVSSTEVIGHLKAAGIGMPKVPRGAPRVAIVTSIMVKAKLNPVQSAESFFVGEALGPRMVPAAEGTAKRPRNDSDDADATAASAQQQPRPQPAPTG